MRVSYSWLKDLVGLSQPVENVADQLSMAGFEVESIEDLSKATQNVVVGYVRSKKSHPNAEKLSICIVDIGGSQPLQIVCGASNVKEGIHVPVAKIGARLEKINLIIKEGVIRGVKSYGMICSLQELGIEDNSDGIAILENIIDKVPTLGTPVAELFGLNDVILDIAITANRPDGMSMRGIAKEIAAITNSKLNLPNIKNKLPIKNKIDDSFNKTDVESCDFYGLTYVTGIDVNRKTPKWISDRLLKAGINAVNSCVDMTNLVMLEQGQPLHAFDADSLENVTGKPVNQLSFTIRCAKKGEQIRTFDGNKINIDENVTIVACNDHPIAIAGVIGSFDTGVTQNTKRIWLESAIFSPKIVRINSRCCGIRTESSSRFEKGLAKEITIDSIYRSIDLFEQVYKNIETDFYSSDIRTRPKTSICLRRSSMNRILGKLNSDIVSNQANHSNNTKTSLPKVNDEDRYIYKETVDNILSRLGCSFTFKDSTWMVDVPAERSSDLTREIDLIEEISRLIGYDNFESSLPEPINPGTLTPHQLSERRLRNILSTSGLQEVMTSSLTSCSDNENRVSISNPLLAEASHLRTNLYEEHLKICARNIKSGRQGCWIYEIGSIFSQDSTEIIQSPVLSGIICGSNSLEKWSTNGKPKFLTYFQARGLLHRSLMGINVILGDSPLREHKLLHPGRASSLHLEGKCIGVFGEFHPSITTDLDLPKASYLFELNLQNVLDSATRKNKWNRIFKPYSTFPTLERDIALIVDSQTNSKEIATLIKKAGQPLLDEVELIDKYSDLSNSNKCSLAFRMRFKSNQKTLKDEEVLPLQEKIRKQLVQKYKVELRS